MFLWSFISFSIIPFCRNFFHVEITGAIQTPVSAGNMLFVLLGYLLGKYNLNKKQRVILYILGVVGLCLHYYMTDILSPAGKPISRLFKGYINFPSVFYGSAVFVFVKNQDWSFLFKSSIFSSLLKLIKDNSLGIYLLHLFFARYLFPAWGRNVGIQDITVSCAYRLLAPPAIAILCPGISCWFKKVPWLNKTMG